METEKPKRKRKVATPETIEVMPPLPLFKELAIGQRFKWQDHEYKKVSSFSAYRNKVGLYNFGTHTPVEIIKNNQA